MLIPEWLLDFLSLIPVTAKEVDIEGSTLLQNGCKVVLEIETLVSPAWSVLPMGCSWSLYFARPALDGLSPVFMTKRRIWSCVDAWVLKRSTCMWTIWVWIAKTQQEADIDLFNENGLALHRSDCDRKSSPWALSWTVSPFVSASVVKDF